MLNSMKHTRAFSCSLFRQSTKIWQRSFYTGSLDCQTLNRENNWRNQSSRNWKSLGSAALFTSLALVSSGNIVSNDVKPIDSSQQLDLIELGDLDQFEEGTLYNIKVLGGKDSLLLVKLNGEYYCCGNSCAHYGAPLNKGTLGPGTITCAFHGAQFDLKTGKALNGPSNNGLPKFETKIQDNKIYALLPKVLPLNIDPEFAKKDPNNKKVFVIIGSGPAGLSAAETLRSEGFTGEIMMVTSDPYLPYDRPVLSKNLKANIDDITIRNKEFIEEKIQLSVINNCTAQSIDPSSHTITLSNGSKIKFDKALVATGGTPNTLDVPGSDLQNIFTLRSASDNASIQPFAKQGARVVVIGSSFIGMEVASALTRMGAKVTVVSKNTAPFQNTLGERIGNIFKKLFIENGVEFFFESEVKSFKGNLKRVNGVELTNGEIIQADAVVYGIGVTPNTNMVKEVKKCSDGSIETDVFMKGKTTPDIYFAGDIAKYPYYKSGSLIRVEHWNNASQLGKVAAQNMMGKYIPYSEIPFFWTMMFGKALRFTGHCETYDDIVYEGEVDKMKFVAYYVKNKKIVAVATMGMDPFATVAQLALKNNLMPTPSEIQLGLANSQSITQNVKEFSAKSTIKIIQ